MPPSGHPARMHGFIRFGGKVAKCAPLNGLVVIVHTERLFLNPLSVYSFPDFVACFGSSESPYFFPPNLIFVLPNPADGSRIACVSK